MPMKATIACLTTLGLALASTVNAQTTTLAYRGELVTGTSTSLLSGTTGPPDLLPLTPLPFSGFVSGTITFSGSLAADNLALVSYDFRLRGTDGSDIGLYALPAGFSGGPNFCGLDSCIDLTLLDGVTPVGATVDLAYDEYHEPQSDLIASPAGDSVSYEQAGSYGSCQSLQDTYYPDGTAAYTGPTIRDCTTDASNIDPGRWTVVPAPEFDPASGYAALTLLLGGLAMLRGRRRVPGIAQ